MKTKVFLFPLPSTVYMPVIRKPLRIFEPRYLDMIKTAVSDNIPVALCYGLSEYEDDTIGIDHESLHYVKSVCGCAKVTIVEETQDNELIIYLEPYKKIILESIISEGLSYNVATAQEIIEFETILPQNFLRINQLRDFFLTWAKAYFKNTKELEDVSKVSLDYSILIALVSEFVLYDPDIKQQVLEFDDINDKLRYVEEVLFNLEDEI